MAVRLGMEFRRKNGHRVFSYFYVRGAKTPKNHMNRKATERMVYFVLVAATGILICSILIGVKKKKAYVPGIIYNRNIKDALQNLVNNAPYQPLFALSTNALDETSLPAGARISLVASLNGLLHAYSDGNVKSFLAFLEPSGLKCQVNPAVVDGLKKDGNVPEYATDSDVIYYMLGKYSDRTYYKGYFSGICIDPLKISSAIGATNEFKNQNSPGIQIVETNTILSSSSIYFLTNYITLGVDARVDLINVSPSPAEVLSRNGTLVYATIYWLIRPSHETEVEGACFPLLARFYFDPPSGKWIPLAVARGNAWKAKTYRISLLF